MTSRWPIAQIGDVCELVNGGTPKTRVQEYWGGKFRWITPAEMGRRESPYVSETKRTLTELGMRDSSARLLPAYSVILSSRASIGHLVINVEPMATNQGCKGLVPSRQIDHKYLYYYLLSAKDILESLGSGTTFKELPAGRLASVKVPVPPLDEQKRIANILDRAFELIGEAERNTKRNIKNVSALQPAALDELFHRLGAKHKITQLGAVCEFENGDRSSNYPNRSVRTASGIPFINAGHFRNNEIDFESMDYIPREAFTKLGAGKIRPKDILFCLRGSLGKFASVRELNEGAIASSLVIVRPRASVSADFLLAYFGSPVCASMVAAYANGAGQPNLSARNLAKFEIPLPPLRGQNAVTSELKKLEYLRQEVDRKFAARTSLIDQFKRSLLDHAFSGKL